jgi:Family of unknown function (DUF5762)
MLWINNPEVLWSAKNLRYFVPSSGMSWDEQANAMVRFIFYLSLILFLYHDNILLIFIPTLIVMGIQYYMYTQELLQPNIERFFFAPIIEHFQYFPNDVGLHSDYDYTGDKNKNPNDFIDHDVKVESFRDINMPNNQVPENPNIIKMNTKDNGIQYIETTPDKQTITCKLPSKDNPFGNPMPFDTIERQVTPICPSEDAKDDKFYEGLFNNVDDLFGRNNSQNSFTTIASSTRENDQEAAIQFFYNTPYTTDVI